MPDTRVMEQTGEPVRQEVITVAIVEDQRTLREGFWMLIDGTPGFRCTGKFRTMEEALERIGYELPDVLLSDIGLPGMNGIEGARILKQRYPGLTVLWPTVCADDN